MLNTQEKTGETPRPMAFKMLRRFITGLRFFPKTHDFFSYFSKSSSNITDGARLLCEMITNREDRASLLIKLRDCEHANDKVTHEVIDLLRQTFLTPFDRSDMHVLVVKMDDILDIIYYIGKRLTIYDVSRMPEELVQLAQIVMESSQELSKAVAGLHDLRNLQDVQRRCIEVKRLETEADEKINTVIARLFSNGWEPCEVIKLKELVENIEAAADKCEDVSNIIESIMLKNS